MQRRVVSGGIYGDALPSGEFGVLIPQQSVRTHFGDIPLPPEEMALAGWGPLYVRVHADGGWQMAGQSHALLGVTWLWQGGQWTRLNQTAFGISPVIFDTHGHLHLATPLHGTQGFRFVADDGRLVTGDQTLFHPQHRLSEWSESGGVVVGQNSDGLGALVVVDGVKRVLEPGDVTFIRMTRVGDAFAFAIRKQLEGAVVLIWATRQDLRALPAFVPSSPPPPPPAKDDKKDDPVGIPSQLHIVQQVRSRFPARPTAAELGAMMNEIAWIANGSSADGPWALSAKPWPKHAPFPGGGFIAEDILQHRPTNTLFDVFVDAGWDERIGQYGVATPAWQPTEHHNHPERPPVSPVRPAGVVAPPPPAPLPVPPTPPTPPAPSVDLQPVLESLLRIEAGHAALHAELNRLFADHRVFLDEHLFVNLVNALKR